MRNSLILVALLWPPLMQAASFCVNDSAELVDALSEANNNGQDDVIRIRNGDYLIVNNEPFRWLNLEPHDLVISGGWEPFNQFDCMIQSGTPYDTTLDGDDSAAVLYLQITGGDEANLVVENLTISNGRTTAVNESAGLRILNQGNPNASEVLIDQVLFLGNDGVNGAGLYYLGTGQLTVRNSVFMFNNTDSGDGVANIAMSANAPGVYFINNTLINNSSDDPSTAATNVSGLLLNLNWDNGDTPEALLANNLFWYQSSNDFYVTFSGGLTHLFHNNYENGGGLIEASGRNRSVPPALSPFLLNFTPEPGSPLIDAGLSMGDPIPNASAFINNWDHGSEDFDRGIITRIHNNQVDIGAVESDWDELIFKSDFD
ncbi:hypothetical protein [Marinicella meishanensis]|uniref:hypothetical protein n=1 Tax=Marinicella meishanensis TaxID=2873263 RepID=UPI001CBACE0B|nr:hypothetical protein [Marinicella sp. NBU2979]